MRVALVALLMMASSARADEIRSQAQIDGGLSVIGPGYEIPLTDHLAAQAEVFVFGTYFLPWFDAGDDVKGFGGGTRATYFGREGGRGWYVTTYFRLVGVDKTSIVGASGIGFAGGAFVGWAFGLSKNVDLRIGAGAQYIHFHIHDDDISTSTPFVALDAVVGYRL